MDLLNLESQFYSWIRGGIFFLLISNVVLFVRNKERIYLYFSIYLFAVVTFVINGLIVNPQIKQFYLYVYIPIQTFGFATYLYFIRELHNTKKDYPKFDRLAKFFAEKLIIEGVFIFFIHLFFGYEFLKSLLLYYVPINIVIVIFSLAFTKIIIKKGGIYSLVASWIFFLGVILSAISIFNKNFLFLELNVHYMFYFFIGVVLQILIYTFLLADAIKRIDLEKKLIEVDLIKRNAQLNELKMTAFKNQMNPHFLFNSLNSINNFVIQNKKELASDYITKFSKLIRKVLETTEKIHISLEEELEIATLYIRIEQARLRNSFNYEFKVDNTINKKELKVVPLFLQPFIENAVWHGLSLNKERGFLSINILDKEENILVEVIDNGIGINSTKKSEKHKSFGIKTIKNRMALIYKKEKVKIKIEDLRNKKEGKGTRVSILFPNKFKIRSENLC